MIKIKKVPALWIKLKILPPGISVALSPIIFLDKKLYEDYMSDSPVCFAKAIIAHETVHIESQKSIGLLKYIFLYFTSKKFCFEEEMRAIKEEMKVYKLHGQQFSTARRAHTLSSFWLYHHCIGYDDAKKALDSLWNQT